MTAVRVLAGVDGAARATGAVVVIDVLRAFTVTAFAIDAGAREVYAVPDLDAAIALGRRLDAIVSAEVDGLPVPGVEISNSPTMLRAGDVRGRVLVQRTTSGVQGLAAAVGRAGDGPVYASALCNAAATAAALGGQTEVTLVATGDDRGHPEDRACAGYLAALLEGGAAPPLGELLAPLYESERYTRISAGGWPGFPPTDLELALTPDRFPFAIQALRQPGGVIRLQPVTPG